MNISDGRLLEYTDGAGITAVRGHYRDGIEGVNSGAQAISGDGVAYAQALGSKIYIYDGDLGLANLIRLRYPFAISSYFDISGLAYSPDGVYLYVLGNNARSVYRVATASGLIDAVVPVSAAAAAGSLDTLIGFPNFGDRLTISEDGRSLAVQGGGAVQVIDTTAIVTGPVLNGFDFDDRLFVTEAGASLAYAFSATSATSAVAPVTFAFDRPLVTADGSRDVLTFVNPAQTADFAASGTIALSDDAGGSNRIVSITVVDGDGHATVHQPNAEQQVKGILFVEVRISLTDKDDIYDFAAQAGNRAVFAGGGDDVISSNLAGNHIDGGDGRDTLVYSDTYREYDVNISAIGYFDNVGFQRAIIGTISRPAGSGDGISDVENFTFSDAILTFDPDASATQVEGLYQGLLRRSGDVAGDNAWNQRLEGGASLHDVAAGFLASAEFRSVNGVLSNSDFVETLYDKVLDRMSDAAGKDFWVGRLDDGSFDRADVVLGFVSSPENRDAIEYYSEGGLFHVRGDAQAVAELYDAAFARRPDAGGFDGWLDAVRDGGATLDQVANAFAPSDGFLQRTGGTSDDAFVDYLYRTALDRDGEASGKAFWVGALDAGTSRGQVLLGFAQGDEHVRPNAANVDQGVLLG